MIHGPILVVLALLLGFGAGRVKHPANLKLAVIKKRLVSIEQAGVQDVKYVIAEIRAKL